MKRLLVWTLCFALVETVFAADAFAIRRTESGSKNDTRISKLLLRLGPGRDSLVAVRLQDKSVVTGFLDEAGSESFVVVDADSQVKHTVAYAQVARLQGYNLVTGVEVHHGLGIRGKIAAVFKYLLPSQRVPANSLTAGEKTLIIGIVIGVLLAIILAKVL